MKDKELQLCLQEIGKKIMLIERQNLRPATKFHYYTTLHKEVLEILENLKVNKKQKAALNCIHHFLRCTILQIEQSATYAF